MRTHGGYALEPCGVDRIEVKLRCKRDETILLGVEPHVGLERDRSSDIHARGDYHRAAARFVASVNSRLYRLCGEFFARVVRAEIQHGECARGESRQGDGRHIERSGLAQRINVRLGGRLIR